MNKKILFLILLAIVMVTPTLVLAGTLGTYTSKVAAAAIEVATPIVVIGWIIAGILWLTSGGSPEKTGLAKKAIVACVVGTIIVVLAMTTTGIINLIRDTFGLGGA